MSECKKCGATIIWRKRSDGSFFPPENPDGSRHTCGDNAPKSIKDAITGRLDTYTTGSATFTVSEDGGQKTYAITPGMAQEFKTAGFLQPPENHADVWLTFTKDAAAFIQPGWKTVQKPDWAARLNDPTRQKTVPVQQQKPPKAPPAEQHQAPCTSPGSSAPEKSPAAEKKDEWGEEREEFRRLLKSTGRDGILELLAHLENDTDFFVAPSSTKYHDARDGGLLHHSLKTYHCLVELAKIFPVEIPKDGTSLVIISLLHDLCKADIYKKSFRNVKHENCTIPDCPCQWNNGWVKEPFLSIEDKYPLGHGEKSVIMLQQYIRLTDTEIFAIRWHMMAYDDSRNSYAGNLSITTASDMYRIIPLFHMADLAASFLDIRTEELDNNNTGEGICNE